MTVYSINKQALEQANLTHASSNKSGGLGGASAQALFTAALAQHKFQIGPVQPGTDSVFRAKFDRPAPEQRPERAERPDARPIRRDDRNPAERTERPKAAEPAERTAPVASNDRPDTQAQPTEAPKTDKPQEAKSEGETAAPVETVTHEDAPAPVAEGTAIVAPTQNNAATQAVQNAAASALAATNGQTANVDGGEDADLDPFAFLAKEFGPAIKDLEDQLEPGDDLANLDVDFGDLLPAQAQANTAQKQAAAPQTAAAIAPKIADDLVSAQANDMARMLAGTGANVKVAVKVDGAQQAATDPALVTGEAETALDEMLTQTLTPNSSANGKGQNGQNGAQPGGQQNAGLANGAAQVAGNPAMVNANAAAAAQARPFAAQVAAQVEGASAPQAQQAGSTPNAAMGPGSTQGTAKPAQAQAPQAPHQPRHVDPKQVIDQVNVQIAKQAKNGADTIRVQLKPVDLGRIEIRLEVQDGKVTAHVTADNKETLAVLQKDARGLERALQDAGLKTEASSMTFSQSGDGQQMRNEAKPARRSRLAARVGNVGGEASAEVAAQPMRSGRRSGVDIKV